MTSREEQALSWIAWLLDFLGALRVFIRRIATFIQATRGIRDSELLWDRWLKPFVGGILRRHRRSSLRGSLRRRERRWRPLTAPNLVRFPTTPLWPHPCRSAVLPLDTYGEAPTETWVEVARNGYIAHCARPWPRQHGHVSPPGTRLVVANDGEFFLGNDHVVETVLIRPRTPFAVRWITLRGYAAAAPGNDVRNVGLPLHQVVVSRADFLIVTVRRHDEVNAILVTEAAPVPDVLAIVCPGLGREVRHHNLPICCGGLQHALQPR
mmetsp:Transcript_22238/g.49216  ORF Transcript_22238/g.49216 Transcript_22238/m.49216 type:complete len:266 (+) Transcript_22238:297-1094(+)